MAENSMQDIRAFLHTEERPLGMSEFRDFWASLSDEEKAEYKNTELPKK